jgi:ketosteroid isomerase-like protein
MSQENLEVPQEDGEELRALAEAVYEALNAADVDRFLAYMADDVEFTSLIAEAEGASFRGREGVRAWWEAVVASFEYLHWDVLEVIPASGGRGIVHFRITGTLSGVPLEQTMWQATIARDGKVSWWAVVRTEREALEAVGLAE